MTKAFNSQESKAAVINYYNMLLNQLTVDYETVSVQTRYGNTFALTAGDRTKTVVILLHGSSMNSAMWLDDIITLAPHYYVIAPDIPGEPGQSDVKQLPLNSNDYAEWLIDVYKSFNIKSAFVVGNSLGGWLALRFGTLYPEKVKKLVLLAPAGIGEQNPAFGLLAMELLPKGEAGIDELFTQINGGMPIPEIRLNYQKLITSVFNARQEIVPIFSDNELQKLNMPCLIFVGAKDIMIKSDETAARAARLIPLCKVETLPERGHSLVDLSNEILEFLDFINITVKGKGIAVLQADKILITDQQSALDLAMTLQYENQCNRIIISKENIAEDFFKLSTGFAGEILQKFINYHIKFAIVGNFSIYTSKPLHDFIYESNKGDSIFFVSTEEEAIQRLTNAI